MSTITATVFRYNPQVDSQPYYKDYEVEWHDALTVLEALRYIHEKYEPISFVYSCRTENCGLCAMKVNGEPVLACHRRITEGESVTIEPLDRFPVIKDLVIDKTPVQNRLRSLSPQFLRPEPMMNPFVVSPGRGAQVEVMQRCCECMLCMSVCPTIEAEGFDNYAGPRILLLLASRYFDEREDVGDLRLQQAVSSGLFKCIECGTCTQVCPKGSILEVEGYPYSFIDHVKYFAQMKEDARAKGMEPVQEEPVRPLAEGQYVS